MVMNNKFRTITSGLLPDINMVTDLRSASLFSGFCEVTCSNLFAFSPYRLHLERKEFLHFQFLADELKEYLGKEDCETDFILGLCRKLYAVYSELMSCCWEAFTCNTDIDDDPGKFLLQQLFAVSEFEKSLSVN